MEPHTRPALQAGEYVAQSSWMQDSAVQIPTEDTRTPKRPLWLWAFAGAWMLCVIGGLSVVWAYDNTPGEGANAPKRWPAETRLARPTDRPTLILLAHPQCSCTRASLAELAEVLARVDRRPKTYVLFLKPATMATGWEKTDLWQTAASLPDATVLRDDDGLEAKRFGAITSGQTVLYDDDGTLLFSGGITGARAHAGDNVGRASLVKLLNRRKAERSMTSVFGCPLFFFGR